MNRICLTVLICMFVSSLLYAQRNVVSLNGQWQLEEGNDKTIPENFRYTVPVPGLVDMANVTFEEVGLKSEKRRMFWYRKEFTVTEKRDIALLKIYQVMYGAKIFLNGRLIAEQYSCFVPEKYEVTNFLKYGGTNELIIGVGAWLDFLPDEYPDGWDVEKVRYIPGISDDVELIFADYPFIEHVECVPDISKREIRVLVKIRNGKEALETTFGFNISGEEKKDITSSRKDTVWLSSGESRIVETVLKIENARLWSPETPYLYTLECSTRGDMYSTRFGMRTFRLDHTDGFSYLNEKPYYWRGASLTLLRFYEDPVRKNLPWDKDWVGKLLRKFKEMNWNSIRICIGFAPSFWYDLADEIGLLIQDEYPIWYVGNHEYGKKKVAAMDADLLVDQYTKWMKERMNHASVVIWDAQNETITPVTGQALTRIREIDHSNRPWDNGWGFPQANNDAMELHPYLFSPNEQVKYEQWGEINHVKSMWFQVNPYKNPQVINEYCQLWLQRDGSPTVRGKIFYDKFFGENLTKQEYQITYAKMLAAETEMWRSLRLTFGVLHLAALGYSIPEAIVGDDFKDPENLVMFEGFDTYVKDAFNPIGIMTGFWEREIASGTNKKIDVTLINDTYQDWEGPILLKIVRKQDDKVVREWKAEGKLKSLGKVLIPFEIEFPRTQGNYQLISEIKDNKGVKVQSIRDLKVTDQ